MNWCVCLRQILSLLKKPKTTNIMNCWISNVSELVHSKCSGLWAISCSCFNVAKAACTVACHVLTEQTVPGFLQKQASRSLLLIPSELVTEVICMFSLAEVFSSLTLADMGLKWSVFGPQSQQWNCYCIRTLSCVFNVFLKWEMWLLLKTYFLPWIFMASCQFLKYSPIQWHSCWLCRVKCFVADN